MAQLQGSSCTMSAILGVLITYVPNGLELINCRIAVSRFLSLWSNSILEVDHSRPLAPTNIPSWKSSKLLQVIPLFISTQANREISELRNAAADRSRWVTLLYCLPHIVPLFVTIIILLLNSFGVYWQDLGRPHQNAMLQALQYAAKAHEVTMAASLTAIVVHQIQHDLSSSKGVPLGFLTAGFQLSDPLFVLRKEFFGGATARAHSRRPSHSTALLYLLIVGFALTLVVGPSSAIAMIPRLDWWDVSQGNAFGPEYTDRVFFNRTEAELWPADISNEIYANLSQCSSIQTATEDCAVDAANIVGSWISLHQSQGTKPNITIFQDDEVTRYLTSQGGPPDNSSWTVSSTIGSIFAKDLDHYWDWLAENSTLPMSMDRPLLRPAFKNSKFKMKKPLVQAQCQTYHNPDWEQDIFNFPHDELLTPPLDEFKEDTWSLPNDFVLNLKGNDSIIGDEFDTSNPWILFDWFDTASNFSNTGAPSLGAVVIYKATNGSALIDSLTTCSFDGRWAPVEYSLDPKNSITIYQNSPNPMDILNGSSKVPAKEMTQMRMSLDWANTLNIQGYPPQDSFGDPQATAVEQMFEGYSGGNFIFPEPAQKITSGYVLKSIDWRISTALGLYLTEGLARAFSDVSKGSMLYRQAPNANQSYVRYLNDINQPRLKEGYKNGKLDWVEMRDPRWNSSILPWYEWAPQNGYTEITFTVQRNGYGYGFDGVPVKLATAALALYILLVVAHVISVLVGGSAYKGYRGIGNMVALAWSSAPTQDVDAITAGVGNYHVWSRMVRAKEEEQRLQLVLKPMQETVVR